MALVFWVSAVVSVVTDVEVGGSEPSTAALVLFAAVLTLMAYGMWRGPLLGGARLPGAARAADAVAPGSGWSQVTTVLQAIGTVLVLAGAGDPLLLHGQGDGADPDAATRCRRE